MSKCVVKIRRTLVEEAETKWNEIEIEIEIIIKSYCNYKTDTRERYAKYTFRTLILIFGENQEAIFIKVILIPYPCRNLLGRFQQTKKTYCTNFSYVDALALKTRTNISVLPNHYCFWYIYQQCQILHSE